MAVGTVATVENDTAYVETDPGVTDSILAALGREQDAENTVPLSEEDIYEIADDGIYLAETDPSADGDTEEDTIRRGADTGQRGTGPTSPKTNPSKKDESEIENEASAERHSDNEDAPPHGEDMTTKQRGEKEDR